MRALQREAVLRHDPIKDFAPVMVFGAAPKVFAVPEPEGQQASCQTRWLIDINVSEGLFLAQPASPD
jgi:hypothetical protein